MVCDLRSHAGADNSPSRSASHDAAKLAWQRIVSCGHAARPRDWLLLVHLNPIRPRVSTQVPAALAPQPRAE